MSNNCWQLPRYCRPCRVVGVFERRKSQSFCKSLSSQLRSYQLQRCCIAPIFSSFFLSIVRLLASFPFFLVLFLILGPILLCQTSSVCTRIGYELFMVSERASEWTTDEKATLCTTGRRTLYIIGESWLHERLRFSVWFTLISAPIYRCGRVRKS